MHSCTSCGRRRPGCMWMPPPAAQRRACCTTLTCRVYAWVLQGPDDAPGMIPLALLEVFRMVERTPQKEFLLRISMIELYNEVQPAASQGMLPPCLQPRRRLWHASR